MQRQLLTWTYVITFPFPLSLSLSLFEERKFDNKREMEKTA
jgi:hypothetical protein